METGHCAEVLREYFAMPRLQRLHKVIDCVFGWALISSNFIVFPFRAVAGPFFISLERQREKQEQHAERRRQKIHVRIATTGDLPACWRRQCNENRNR